MKSLMCSAVVFCSLLATTGCSEADRTEPEEPLQETYQPAPSTQALLAAGQLKFGEYGWRLDGGSLLVVSDLSIENTGTRSVKDIEIVCLLAGDSGTVIERPMTTIFSEVPPRETIVVREVSFGFVNSQATRISCIPYKARLGPETSTPEQRRAYEAVTEAHNKGWKWAESNRHSTQQACEQLKDADEIYGCNAYIKSLAR